MKTCKHCGHEIADTFIVEWNNEKWEVENESKEIILRDLKIPEGWQLMPFNLAVFLYDENKLIPHKEWELTEGLSKKNIQLGYKYSALGRGWVDSLRLSVGGVSHGGVDGYAFGVRFCRRIK